ncbi:fungal-specific transcription factor domain-containing protein [Circinella umbellata]|nr:fungal-specific transcription factor domain-containing protein [Circinella umbellata]
MKVYQSNSSNNLNNDNNDTNPPQQQRLKRTRAKRSCDFCRKRKSRCDADTSIPCSNCKAWGYTCEFQTVRKKRGPPSVYVDNLEKRCKKMEKLLISLTNASIKELEKNDFQLDRQKTIGKSINTRNKKGKARAMTAVTAMNTEDSNDEDEIDDDQDSLDSNGNDNDNDFDIDDFDNVSIESQNSSNTPNIPLEERLSNLNIKDYDAITYTGRSASMDLLNTELFRFKPYIAWPNRSDVALQLTAQNELMVVRSVEGTLTRLDIGLSMRSGGADISTPKEESDTITPPSKHVQEKLITFFFEHLHPFMPIINKERFLSAEQPPNILIQAILALTFRFVSQHEPTEQYPNASEYATMYSAKVVNRLRDPVRSRLCHVQSAVLMTLYLDMDDGDDSMQWYMLGTAIRMAQDLGLHRSCSHWKILPQPEIETRHRLFYACYVLDRWLSARAGKPLTILDRDFDTPMPSNNEYYTFTIMIKLSEILGRVLKALYAPKAKHANANAGLDDPTVIDAFDRRLKSCKHAMETKIPITQKAYLDIFYHTILLLLHRPFMGQQQLSHQICTHAATTIMDLTRHIRQQPKKDNQYFSLCMPTCFVYALFQSTLVHLANAVRDPTLFEMFQQSVVLMQQYNHLLVVRRALEIVELFRTMHAPSVDAAAAAAVAAARVAAIHAIPFPSGTATTMMLSDIYNVSQPATPLVGATTGTVPLYDWSPMIPSHHPHHQSHQQHSQQHHDSAPHHHHHSTPQSQLHHQQGIVENPSHHHHHHHPSATTTGIETVFPTTFQGDLMNNNLILTASPTSMHATVSQQQSSSNSTTTNPPPSNQNNNPTPYHANSTSSTSSSSASSFISTPHPMAAMVPQPNVQTATTTNNNLHWTDWNMYLQDERTCQHPHRQQHIISSSNTNSNTPRQSRHHHSASFPQASFSHLPHPPH